MRQGKTCGQIHSSPTHAMGQIRRRPAPCGLTEATRYPNTRKRNASQITASIATVALLTVPISSCRAATSGIQRNVTPRVHKPPDNHSRNASQGGAWIVTAINRVIPSQAAGKSRSSSQGNDVRSPPKAAAIAARTPAGSRRTRPGTREDVVNPREGDTTDAVRLRLEGKDKRAFHFTANGMSPW